MQMSTAVEGVGVAKGGGVVVFKSMGCAPVVVSRLTAQGARL